MFRWKRNTKYKQVSKTKIRKKLATDEHSFCRCEEIQKEEELDADCADYAEIKERHKAEQKRETELMKIKVKVYATLRKYIGDKSSTELEVDEGTTVGQVLAELKIPEDQVAFVFVNSVHKELDYALAQGDDLGVFPPIAGG